MTGLFYTYVWGTHGRRGGPLTFTSKQNRTVAIRSTQEGDLVFGVVSRNPGDPDVQIPDELRGRVANVWQISHGTADTAEFGIEAQNSWDRLEDGSYRWPFALQPIRTWIIRDAPEFRDLPGYTPSTHTQRAITTVQELGDELAATLKDLLATNGEELEVMTPRFQTMASRVNQLRQKHPFALNGYSVQPNVEATNCIYIATLGKTGRVLKIGHAQDAKQRLIEFNKFRLSNEPQWVLHTDQPIGSVQDAIEVEKYLGEAFAKHRTETNNNEIYVDLDPMAVLTKLATFRR
ncbi:GIY-YIG nuclease family protein [Paracoccus stylophorae]|uniref:GIY-YIG nuclease family protein n=1 Tax=Paracoccus stylophorae TaxID=659350 RepID=A0ABY7SY86_9RHOB|nr:GIY-YIG nuclease family protein [Paracoccus stylophorae]WCR11984.1 GIY-YIG nuclease family protein [Paracoccus stylophorae]